MMQPLPHMTLAIDSKTPGAASIDIHLHWLDLDAPPEADASRLLSEAESARAARFSSAEQARRWIAGRVALRRLIGARLHVAPERVSFDTSIGGKPHLLVDATPHPLAFSLSRSSDIAIVALADGIELGVDVECAHRLSFRSSDFEDAVLSAAERSAVHALAPDERPRAVQRLWVRKEAIVKARGTGFTVAPTSIDVGHVGTVSAVQDAPHLGVRWIDLAAPVAGAAAALAIVAR